MDPITQKAVAFLRKMADEADNAWGVAYRDENSRGKTLAFLNGQRIALSRAAAALERGEHLTSEEEPSGTDSQ